MLTNHRSSPAAALVAAGFILLPVVYVLSTGPMVWLRDRHYIPQAALFIFAPLDLLCDSCKLVEWFLNAYLKLWEP